MTPSAPSPSDEASRHLLEQLTQQMPGVIFQYRLYPDGRSCIPYASAGLFDLYGLTPEQVREDASAAWAVLHPDDQDLLTASMQTSARQLAPWVCEYRLLSSQQGVRWCSCNAKPQRLEDGSVLWHGCITDITQRKQWETERDASSHEMLDLYNHAPCGYHSVDAQGILVRINDTELAWLGYAREELVGKLHILDLLSPASRALYQTHFAQFKATGRLSGLELELMRKDGTTLPVRVDATRVTDTHGQFVMSRSVVVDMTETRQAQKVQWRLYRALQMLSKCNMALVHATQEQALLEAVCRLIVEEGGYRMAWVGYAEQDAARQVRPVAEFGVEAGYLAQAQISWADNERGRGPTGTAIREGTVQVNQNFLTNPKTAVWRETALKQGYQSSIALPLRVEQQTLGALTLYAVEPDAFSAEEIQLLQELTGDLAFGISTLRTAQERDHAQQALRTSLESAIQAIAATVEMRDPYTAGHQRRVAELAQAIAQEMGLAPDRVHALGLAASIHDLGKIRVPVEILSKPGKLTALEYGMIQKHAATGYDILKDVAFPWPVAEWIRQHHERIDGTGYPQGLKGDAIHLEARIMAVADVVEAISSHRPYRPGWGLDTALDEITRHQGTLYDTDAVAACLRLFHERQYALPT